MILIRKGIAVLFGIALCFGSCSKEKVTPDKFQDTILYFEGHTYSYRKQLSGFDSLNNPIVNTTIYRNQKDTVKFTLSEDSVYISGWSISSKYPIDGNFRKGYQSHYISAAGGSYVEQYTLIEGRLNVSISFGRSFQHESTFKGVLL